MAVMQLTQVTQLVRTKPGSETDSVAPDSSLQTPTRPLDSFQTSSLLSTTAITPTSRALVISHTQAPNLSSHHASAADTHIHSSPCTFPHGCPISPSIYHRLKSYSPPNLFLTGWSHQIGHARNRAPFLTTPLSPQHTQSNTKTWWYCLLIISQWVFTSPSLPLSPS